MNSSKIGQQAERAAVVYLRHQGFAILYCNWRTRWCEIDIVAQKADVIYLVEVRYRSNRYAGDGLESINSTKLAKLHKAANIWASINQYDNDYRLIVVSMSEPDFTVDECVEID